MSYQCTDISSDLAYREVEAWWNMLNCIFKFISASTDCALETCSRSETANNSPLLLIELPDSYRDVYLEDFPWFLDQFDDSAKIKEISSDKDYNVYHAATVSNAKENQHEEPNPPIHKINIVNTANDGDTCVLKRDNVENGQAKDVFVRFSETVENMYEYEESCMKTFDEKQEETLYLKAKEHEMFETTIKETNNESPSNSNRDNSDIKAKDERKKLEQTTVIKDASEESCYFQDYTDSADTIDSSNLQSNYESTTAIDKSQKSENNITSKLIIEENQSECSNSSVRQASKNPENPVNIETVIANKESREKEPESEIDIDSMVSEEIQTTVNKRFSGTLKAQIAKSEELQKPLKEMNACNNNYSKTAGILSISDVKIKAGELSLHPKGTPSQPAPETLKKLSNTDLKKPQKPTASTNKNTALPATKIKFAQNVLKNTENNLENKKPFKRIPTPSAKQRIDISIEDIVKDIITQSTNGTEAKNKPGPVKKEKPTKVIKEPKNKPNLNLSSITSVATSYKITSNTANRPNTPNTVNATNKANISIINKSSSNASSVNSSRISTQKRPTSPNIPLRPHALAKTNSVKNPVILETPVSNRNTVLIKKSETPRKLQNRRERNISPSSQKVQPLHQAPPKISEPPNQSSTTKNPPLTLNQKNLVTKAQKLVKPTESAPTPLRKSIPKTSVKK